MIQDISDHGSPRVLFTMNRDICQAPDRWLCLTRTTSDVHVLMEDTRVRLGPRSSQLKKNMTLKGRFLMCRG